MCSSERQVAEPPLEHSEALLERGFSYLALGDKKGAEMDFSKVLVLVPPGSDAARRAEAGLRGEQPSAATPAPAAKGGDFRKDYTPWAPFSSNSGPS